MNKSSDSINQPEIDYPSQIEDFHLTWTTQDQSNINEIESNKQESNFYLQDMTSKMGVPTSFDNWQKQVIAAEKNCTINQLNNIIQDQVANGPIKNEFVLIDQYYKSSCRKIGENEVLEAKEALKTVRQYQQDLHNDTKDL